MNNKGLERVFDKGFKKYKNFVKPATYLVINRSVFGADVDKERLNREINYIAVALKMGSELTKKKYLITGAIVGVAVGFVLAREEKVEPGKEEA